MIRCRDDTRAARTSAVVDMRWMVEKEDLQVREIVPDACYGSFPTSFYALAGLF